MKSINVIPGRFFIVSFLCFWLSFSAFSQQTVEQKQALAQSFELGSLMAKANAGDAQAQYELGMKYLNGEIKGTFETPDKKEAARWFAKSANGGSSDGMVAHGDCLRCGILYQDKKEAFKWYKNAAKKNNRHAIYYLGVCFRDGVGVARDYKVAFENFNKAYAMGHMWAANALAGFYFEGLVVDKNLIEAFKLWEEASANGDTIAYSNLGRCYMFGQGTEIDPKLGCYWYEKSADAGYVAAQFFLGELYYNGASPAVEGVNIRFDYKKAAHFLQLAAKNKNLPDYAKGETYRYLAECYRFGRGVEQDQDMANYYTREAAKYGDSNAAEIIKWLNME